MATEVSDAVQELRGPGDIDSHTWDSIRDAIHDAGLSDEDEVAVVNRIVTRLRGYNPEAGGVNDLSQAEKLHDSYAQALRNARRMQSDLLQVRDSVRIKRNERDQAIRKAVAAGRPMRQIAVCLGITQSEVHRINQKGVLGNA